ncbi:MAG TPA: ATP-binding protein, partial [Blastocatellia bacterium]|nr:ATP-binding protein [Blastocatellia bacterium]
KLELIGRSWQEFVGQEAQNTKWHEEVTKYLQHGLPFTAQAQASRAKDGQETYWNWTVWPVKDEEGEVESVLLMGTEITAIIQARQQLEEALADAWTERNKLEAVIENITDAVFISDAQTKQVVRVNSAAARLLGFEDRQELEAHLVNNSLRLDCAQCDSEASEGHLSLAEDWLVPSENGETRREAYRVWHRQDHAPIQVIVGSSPVRNSNGEIALVVSIAHDVTKLLEIQNKLEESNRTKDVFLAMLSHELRTPLTPILGWVNILRRQQKNEMMLGHGLDVIERNAKLQSQLVDDLLDLSRITLSKIEVTFQPVDVNEIVRRALETVQGSLEQKKLNIELNLSEEPIIVNADARRFEQVIWNLMSNAIKFTNTGGHISIRSRLVGRLCEIEVADTGIGIPAHALPTIFMPFRQADSSITRRHGGLGIGLSIAQSLVELHGGQITAESSGEGHGSRFIVTLPAQAMTHTPVPVRTAPSLVPTLVGLRVLLLEDSEDTRELLGLLLRTQGCEVRLAESVAEGLKLANESRP